VHDRRLLSRRDLDVDLAVLRRRRGLGCLALALVAQLALCTRLLGRLRRFGGGLRFVGLLGDRRLRGGWRGGRVGERERRQREGGEESRDRVAHDVSDPSVRPEVPDLDPRDDDRWVDVGWSRGVRTNDPPMGPRRVR
jgi:hypothetical protein